MPGYVKFILIVYSRFPLISFLLPLFPSYWLLGRNTTLRRSFLSLKTILLLYPPRLYFTFTGAKSITSLSRSGSCLHNSSMLSHKSSSLYQQVISPYWGRPLPSRPAFRDFSSSCAAIMEQADFKARIRHIISVGF